MEVVNKNLSSFGYIIFLFIWFYAYITNMTEINPP